MLQAGAPKVPVKDASAVPTQQTRDVVRDVTSAEFCHGSIESNSVLGVVDRGWCRQSRA